MRAPGLRSFTILERVLSMLADHVRYGVVMLWSYDDWLDQQHGVV